jgi:hypothetical protein
MTLHASSSPKRNSRQSSKPTSPPRKRNLRIIIASITWSFVRDISIYDSQQEGPSTFIPSSNKQTHDKASHLVIPSNPLNFHSDLAAATAHPSSSSASTASSPFCICRGTTRRQPSITYPCSALWRILDLTFFEKASMSRTSF